MKGCPGWSGPAERARQRGAFQCAGDGRLFTLPLLSRQDLARAVIRADYIFHQLPPQPRRISEPTTVCRDLAASSSVSGQPLELLHTPHATLCQTRAPPYCCTQTVPWYGARLSREERPNQRCSGPSRRSRVVQGCRFHRKRTVCRGTGNRK